MTPLADAMGLVDRQQIDLKILKQAEIAWEHQAFWCHIEKAIVACPKATKPSLGFLHGEGGVEKRGGNAIRQESINLIFHQGNEWGDNDGDTRSRQRG